jgi:divalent metal cation (Fe/Co/Zn/Cd) transporter
MSTTPIELTIAVVGHDSAPARQPLQPHERARLARRARALSLLSIAWMSVEAVVAILSAVIAGSVALLGFGLDSLIELASASTILWLYTGERSGSQSAERRAQQLIALCFAALALYVTFDAIDTLANGSHPGVSWPGLAVTAGAITFMPLLARAKGRVASQLASAATAGDAAQSWLCAISAATVLVSILANALLGWWWLDPITGLGIAALAVHEGRAAWAGEVCADCAPVGPQSTQSCSRDESDCCG